MARVLVIDDDAEMREWLRLVLQRHGSHEVICSPDGTQGLAEALANQPNLAIVDIMMPGVTGLDVCRQLRASPATASVPIIVLTARGQPVDRQAALAAGATAYLAKPTSTSDLLEMVDTTLAQAVVSAGSSQRQIITLLGLRGGVGATTLAVNMAAALARSAVPHVCLVDLCPASGHVALQLGLRPVPNWSDVLASDEIGPDAVAGLLLAHESGLRVLAAPVVPPLARDLSLAQAQALLRALQQHFDVLVVDAPPLLSAAAMAAVEMAWRVGLVTTADPPALQTAAGTLRALMQWSDKCHMILNRPAPEPQWPADALTRLLGRAPTSEIPWDPSQAQAIRTGRPLALDVPNAPLTLAVYHTIKAIAQTAPGGA